MFWEKYFFTILVTVKQKLESMKKQKVDLVKKMRDESKQAREKEKEVGEIFVTYAENNACNLISFRKPFSRPSTCQCFSIHWAMDTNTSHLSAK